MKVRKQEVKKEGQEEKMSIGGLIAAWGLNIQDMISALIMGPVDGLIRLCYELFYNVWAFNPFWKALGLFFMYIVISPFYILKYTVLNFLGSFKGLKSKTRINYYYMVGSEEEYSRAIFERKY